MLLSRRSILWTLCPGHNDFENLVYDEPLYLLPLTVLSIKISTQLCCWSFVQEELIDFEPLFFWLYLFQHKKRRNKSLNHFTQYIENLKISFFILLAMNYRKNSIVHRNTVSIKNKLFSLLLSQQHLKSEPRQKLTLLLKTCGEWQELLLLLEKVKWKKQSRQSSYSNRARPRTLSGSQELW